MTDKILQVKSRMFENVLYKKKSKRASDKFHKKDTHVYNNCFKLRSRAINMFDQPLVKNLIRLIALGIGYTIRKNNSYVQLKNVARFVKSIEKIAVRVDEVGMKKKCLHSTRHFGCLDDRRCWRSNPSRQLDKGNTLFRLWNHLDWHIGKMVYQWACCTAHIDSQGVW